MINSFVSFEAPQVVAVAEGSMPAPAEGELLVETRVSLISTGTELTMLSAEDPPGTVWAALRRFPSTPGYSNVGRVIDTGSTADRGWIGKRVASTAPHARYNSISTTAARLVPDERISDEEAAFCTLAEIVMNGVRRSGVTWGESVVVFGLGLLGQLAVRFCQFAGAWPIFAVDIGDERLAAVPDDPGVIRVNAAHDDVSEMVGRSTAGRMADVAFEVTGISDLIPNEITILRQQGRFVILSSPRGAGTFFNFHDLCNRPSYTIIGAHNMSHPDAATLEQPWTGGRNAELFLTLAAERKIEVGSLISHRYPYRDAPLAYAMLLEDRSRAMGAVLDW